MGTAEMAPTRWSCSVENCGMNFANQRELHDHKDQLHGELRHLLRTCYGSSAASSSAEVKESAMIQQTENGMKFPWFFLSSS